MEQHAVPRQITTFEFKLIGFMTIKQFIYLLVFISIGFVIYYIFPVPILNFILAILVGALGPVFAFVPIYDRPVDVWIKNLYKRLNKPTQFLYKKSNKPIYFLSNLYFVSDPHRTSTHIESEEKLNAYLAGVNKNQQNNNNNQPNQKKQTIVGLFRQKAPVKKQINAANQTVKRDRKQAFFTGVVKNHKLIDLPGILIYVKNQSGQTLRLLKTNPHGVFATFSSLPVDDYFFEIKDPNNNYFFDTMKIRIETNNPKPIEVFSKELI